MKIPIILQSTKGKTKKQLVKEFMGAWKKFLTVKKKVEKSKQQAPEVKFSEKSIEPTKSKFVNKMLGGRSYQIMGQSKPKKNPLQSWLEDSEQIPEEGESIDEFIKRTNWTLKEENKWRKIDGLPPLKGEQEYRRLFEEKN